MTITLTREEAQQVLDALEDVIDDAEEPHKTKNAFEFLRAKLSEPEAVAKMQEMLEVQGSDGNWNYDPYMHGMYNGMEYMLSMVESREPVFREAPKKWLSKREWVGLTDEEMAAAWSQSKGDVLLRLKPFASAIEAKLKEKNT